MAVLALSDNRVWHGSGAILAFIAERLNASGAFPRYSKQFAHILAGWNDLDFTDASADDLVRLKLAVSKIVSEVRANGPDAHGGEAPYSGLLARLNDLQTLLDLASNYRE